MLQRVCSENFRGLQLKKEQEKAVLALLEKKDFFAILSTGFGKSLIYQSYSVAKKCYRWCDASRDWGIYIINFFLINLLCIYETFLATNSLCKFYKPKFSHKLTAKFHFYI